MNTGAPTSLIGVACLVWWQGRLVLEVQKPHKWYIDDRQEMHIGLGCIGGGINEGESAIDALQREAMEEMGCQIALCDAPVTYAVGPDCRVVEMEWQAPGARPVLVWEACLPGLVPGRCVAVFRGRAVGEPIPGDLPALLCVTPELLFKVGGGGLRLAEAHKLGATLYAQVPVPEKAWLELVGTPAVLNLLNMQGKSMVKEIMEPNL